MKIVIKTLQGKQLPLEVEEADTVPIECVDSMFFVDRPSEAEDPSWTLIASRADETNCLW